MRMSLLRGTVLGALLACGSAFGQTLTIVTSFPKDLTEVYKQAFEKRNPGVKVEIQNKGTSAGVAYVREAPANNKPDIFWASAPDAFEVLAKDKLLQKYEGRNPAIPAKIGSYPVNDPEGFYYGQALAGYGLMWNTRYMKANKLPEPREWADLMKPVYFGHVAVSSVQRPRIPLRSGRARRGSMPFGMGRRPVCSARSRLDTSATSTFVSFGFCRCTFRAMPAIGT